MADLGKAYVQIVPSAQGISGSISKVLGGEASSAGESAGESIASKLIGKLKTVIAAAGIGKFVSDAISEGADYEQMVGGMVTLYKEDSETMVKYANEAFKTAQISANEYMDTATKFSASLLTSLGGDTKKAAEAANSAIIDMADNANKMGTNMEDIQNAYKGFAKQNYTMLDNLSLGYGGTKEEMERLLANAEKVTGIKYDISNLNDVYSAIHVIQGEMGITGTSALEAGTTVSGAVNMMKSAWSNLLAQMSSSEGGDVTGAMKNLVTSIFGDGTETNLGVLGTVVPSIIRLGASIGPALLTAVTVSFSQIRAQLNKVGIDSVADLANGIMSNAQAMITSGITAVNNFINGITSNLPTVCAQANTMLTEFLSAISVQLPSVLAMGNELVFNLVAGLLNNLPTLITGAGQLVLTFVTFLLTNMPTFIEQGFNMISAIVQGIGNNLPSIAASAGTMIGKFIAVIVANLPLILLKGAEMIIKLLAGIVRQIPNVLKAIYELVVNIATSFISGQDWGQVGHDIIAGVTNGLIAAGSMLWDAITDIASQAFSAVKDFFGIASPSKLMRDEIGKFIPAGIAKGIEQNADLVTNAMDSLGDDTLDSALTFNSGKLSGNVAGNNGNTTVNMNIYGAEGQDINELAQIISEKLNAAVTRKTAVFA